MLGGGERGRRNALDIKRGGVEDILLPLERASPSIERIS